ncbi:MAG: hypothetical protein LDLANPLL_01588 [Turneriella sp.]|nr:hypothetical protein [Turneriella sp.]
MNHRLTVLGSVAIPTLSWMPITIICGPKQVGRRNGCRRRQATTEPARTPAIQQPPGRAPGKYSARKKPPWRINVGLHVVPTGMKAVGERSRTIAGM